LDWALGFRLRLPDLGLDRLGIYWFWLSLCLRSRPWCQWRRSLGIACRFEFHDVCVGGIEFAPQLLHSIQRVRRD
jgi:hypothetical protein